MGLGKGKTNNPAGRPKGAIGKKTRQWNVFGDAIMNEHIEKFNEELSKLSGKDFVQAYTNILEYFQPKLQRTEIEQDNEINIRIIRE